MVCARMRNVPNGPTGMTLVLALALQLMILPLNLRLGFEGNIVYNITESEVDNQKAHNPSNKIY